MQGAGVILQMLASAVLGEPPAIDPRGLNAVEDRTEIARIAPRPRAVVPCAPRSMLMSAPDGGVATFRRIATREARPPRRTQRCFHLISS